MRFVLQQDDGGREAAIGGLARELLSSGAVEGVFIPQYNASGSAAYATFVHDAESLLRPAPLAPYLGGNRGREAGMVSGGKEGGRIAAFLRPCEARAFIELSKLKQADREATLLVTIDCPGTLSLDDYTAYRAGFGDARECVGAFYGQFHAGQTAGGSVSVRAACSACESLAHPRGDVAIKLVGAAEGDIVVESLSCEGEAALEATGAVDDPGCKVDEPVRESFSAVRAERDRERRNAWRAEINSMDDFISLLSNCRRCYNCRAECPICYCRECVFKTATFEADADTFGRRADRFGAVRMPPDTLVFHLVRLNHMATSCVACGQCGEACPQGIEVGRIFSAVSAQVQEMFDYSAGADPAHAAPLTEFREEELEPR